MPDLQRAAVALERDSGAVAWTVENRGHVTSAPLVTADGIYYTERAVDGDPDRPAMCYGLVPAFEAKPLSPQTDDYSTMSTIRVVWRTATAPTEMAAYDAALADADIHNYNLVASLLSFPPNRRSR